MSNDDFKNEIFINPALKKFKNIALIASLFILGLSFIWSIYCSNWEYFSRSGSLLVILGIYVTIKDISEVIRKQTDDVNKTVRESLNDLITDSENEEQMRERLHIHQNAFEEASNEAIRDSELNSSNVHKSIRQIEVVLLIGGTFIWGYGDIILEKIWPLSA